MRRACAFIQSGYDGILKKCGHTANRVFIAAKAFGLCGVVLRDERLKATSRTLVAAALQRRDADGVFVECGGRDTSYNAVSLLMAQVLAVLLYPIQNWRRPWSRQWRGSELASVRRARWKFRATPAPAWGRNK